MTKTLPAYINSGKPSITNYQLICVRERWCSGKHETKKHFLNYVVASLIFRLPTWRLQTTNPYDSRIHQTQNDTGWLM
jgi:hypothetical protein